MWLLHNFLFSFCYWYQYSKKLADSFTVIFSLSLSFFILFWVHMCSLLSKIKHVPQVLQVLPKHAGLPEEIYVIKSFKLL